MTSGYVERHDYEKGFAAHYDEYLKPEVEAFEAARRKALATSRKRFWIALPIWAVIIASAIFSLDQGAHPQLVLFIGGALAVGVYLFVIQPKQNYKDSIKDEIFPKMLSFLGDFNYTSDVSDRMKWFSSYGIVPSYDSESSEDRVVGKYEGVSIDLFETMLTEKRGSGKSSRTVTVFRGLVIELGMSKSFSGKTIVSKDAGAIGNWFKSKFSSLETVRLEDPRFEDEFEVMSDDQVEARYLLTPAFMERLLDLRHVVGGSQLSCSFYQDKLLLLIDVKRDMFEPGPISQPEDFIDDAQSLLAEMNAIFSIITTLKLNENIGV